MLLNGTPLGLRFLWGADLRNYRLFGLVAHPIPAARE